MSIEAVRLTRSRRSVIKTVDICHETAEELFDFTILYSLGCLYYKNAYVYNVNDERKHNSRYSYETFIVKFSDVAHIFAST